jgi:hypothetical protein
MRREAGVLMIARVSVWRLWQKTRTGNHFWFPASLACFLLRRDNARGTSSPVRTARAVWSFAFRMHARWSYTSCRQHAFFLLLCTVNCKPFRVVHGVTQYPVVTALARGFTGCGETLAEAGFVNTRTLEAPGPSPLILATKP